MSSIYGLCCGGRYPLPRPDRLQNVREDCLHFRSLSLLSDRSIDVPRGAMWASPPTLKTHVFYRRRCPHRPVAGGTGVSVFLDRSVNVPHGAMRASPPTLKTHVFVGADAHIGPRAKGFVSVKSNVAACWCTTENLLRLHPIKKNHCGTFSARNGSFCKIQEIRTRTSSRCNPSAH